MNLTYEQPALLEPRYFPYIWGGTLLRDCLGKNIPSDTIGESWEVSAHPRGQSVIASGPACGMPFGEYAAGAEFYGGAAHDRFPLLVKFLGASENLSVQVHPSDDNCGSGEAGKAEAWVVLHAQPGAELVYGIKGTAEEFAAAAASGHIEEQLRYVPVRPGDVLDIAPGTVHALTQGVVVYEVQQNSDTTYRLYDWGRVDATTGKPRPLHIEAALRVVRPSGIPSMGERCIRSGGRFCKELLVCNTQFALERIAVDGCFTDDWHNGFAAYSVIDGSGEVQKGGQGCFAVELGDSFICPAAAGPAQLSGEMTLLKTYVPLHL